jgi:hypothetical protein
VFAVSARWCHARRPRRSNQTQADEDATLAAAQDAVDDAAADAAVDGDMFARGTAGASVTPELTTSAPVGTYAEVRWRTAGSILWGQQLLKLTRSLNLLTLSCSSSSCVAPCVSTTLTPCLPPPLANVTLPRPSFVAEQEDAPAAQAVTAASDAAAADDLVVINGTAGEQSAAAEVPTTASAEVRSCEATFGAKAACVLSTLS